MQETEVPVQGRFELGRSHLRGAENRAAQPWSGGRGRPVDDGLGVFCTQLVQKVSMGLLGAMQGGFQTVP